MTDEVTIVLPGTPQAKGRPRFTSQGRAYTDARTKAAERALAVAWAISAGTRQPHDGPVSVHLDATFEPAASWPKWKREKALAGEWPHTSKPDIDNLVKILDGLNGRAWIDDAQIIAVTGTKRYGPAALTVVTIQLHPKQTKENQ